MVKTSTYPEAGTGRLAVRRAVWQAGAAALATAALVVGVDLGAKILDPILIVTGGLTGAITIRAWWRHRGEEWYAAEIALVTVAWGLFAASFAALQYLVFSFVPGSFYVDPEYARLISPRYHREWARDSARTAEQLGQVDGAARLLSVGAPPRFAADSSYPLAEGGVVRVLDECETVVPGACRWRLVVTTPAGAKPFELTIEAPGDGRGLLRADLEQHLGREAARLREHLGDLGRRIDNPAGYISPRIGDFLYDTAIAFSGRDSGVFSPVGGLARLFKVLESLASYVLFGIVVSRVAAAAGPRVSP